MGRGRLRSCAKILRGAQFELQCSFAADPPSKNFNPLKLSIKKVHSYILGIRRRNNWTNPSATFYKLSEIYRLHIFLNPVNAMQCKHPYLQHYWTG